MISAAGAAGFVLAALIARHGSKAWIPPETKDEIVPARKPLAIPRIGGEQSIRGTVQAADGRPVARAIVRVSAGYVLLETATDDLGVFSADKLPSDLVTVVAYAPGFHPEMGGPFTPPKKDITDSTRADRGDPLADQAVAGVGSLLVTVAAAETMERLPRLTIAAIPEAKDGRDFALLPRMINLDNPAQPSARFAPLPVGRYRVLAVPRGASPDARLALAESTADVEPNKEPRIDLTVRYGFLTGRVTHRSEAVARAFVRAYRRARNTNKDQFLEPLEVELGRAVTDADGNFRISELPTGDMMVEILSSGFQPWSRSVAIGAEPRPLEVEVLKAN